ncbi:hemerythrin domain-containing protein [Mycolicibacter terrae]|uniref:hemerythrin domain-containing protein n=1 Tax=Mycolicibacter terrae TaxID=1788 RepID=UPI000A14ECF6|nr:hemerythrin domain-containing protein [Mycolicibacter terrae]ORW97395.1 hemerythrin [Mycolicibacter terrae]
MDKPDTSPSAALEREHQELDARLEGVLSGLIGGRVDVDALNAALDGLRRHIYLEERILFPPIRHAGMAMPIAVMMTEHGEIWRTMDALAGLVAGGDTERMGAICRLLLDQLAVHNSKEEQVIYRAADTGLDPDQAEELTDFIETGLMPDCWECLEAR